MLRIASLRVASVCIPHHTSKWRPATSSVDEKEGGDAVTDRADARARSHRTLKIAALQSYALGT
jgi:hypothetical protein